MSDTYTVCFFGDRTVRQPAYVKEKIKKIISDVIEANEDMKFLVGEDGFFDVICSFTISEFLKRLNDKKASLVLVLPYMNSTYCKYPEHFLNYYDEVEICDKSSVVYFKAVMEVRNQIMIDRSDLVVCYVLHGGGEAANTLKYAKKQQKNIINVAEE